MCSSACAHDQHTHTHTHRFVACAYLEPLMAKGALSSETLLWVYNKELVDKILGLGGYVVPVRRRILKVTFQYLVEHLIVIFCVEWRISTKPVRKRDIFLHKTSETRKTIARERERERERCLQNIHYNAHSPHI